MARTPDPALLPDREQWPPPCEIGEALFLLRSPPAFKSSWERPRLMGLGDPGVAGTWGGRNMGWPAEGPTAGGMQTEEVPRGRRAL